MSWHQWIAAWRLLRFSSSIVPHLLTGIVDPVIFCKVNHTRRVLYGKLFNMTPKASLQNISPWKSPWSQLYQNFFANFKSGLSTRGPTSLDSRRVNRINGKICASWLTPSIQLKIYQPEFRKSFRWKKVSVVAARPPEVGATYRTCSRARIANSRRTLRKIMFLYIHWLLI